MPAIGNLAEEKARVFNPGNNQFYTNSLAIVPCIW
jgi:hypothetical protein